MDVLGMIHYLAGEEEARAWACAVGLAQDLLSRTSRADRAVGRFLWVSSSTVSSLKPEGGDQETFLQ